MIEVTTLENATREKLVDAQVIMTMGYGDPQSPKVLCGRDEFVEAAKTRATAKELSVLRVKISSDEDFEKLKARVEAAKSGAPMPEEEEEKEEADDESKEEEEVAAESEEEDEEEDEEEEEEDD